MKGMSKAESTLSTTSTLKDGGDGRFKAPPKKHKKYRPMTARGVMNMMVAAAKRGKKS